MIPELDRILTWLLNLEDRGLTGKSVSLADGQGLTRFGITTLTLNAEQHLTTPTLPADFFSLPVADAIPVAKTFYQLRYWEPLGLSLLPMPLAASLLSCAVNCGPDQALRFYDYAKAVGVGPDNILANFIKRWIIHYIWLVDSRPATAPYLAGWKARAAATYPNLP